MSLDLKEDILRAASCKPNPNFRPPASVKQGAYTPDFRKPTPPPPPTPAESIYTKIINNPYYKNHIEIKQSQNGMWDMFVNSSWACSRNAWENIISELSKIMKEISES